MTSEADAAHRVWLREHLEQAAKMLATAVAGEPIFGWHDHTVGARVVGEEFEAWLKVRFDLPRWGGSAWWRGEVEANALIGVPRPKVLDWREWVDGERVLRADLMTLLHSQPISTDLTVRHDPGLGPDWWAGLRRALDTLAATGRDRECLDPAAFRPTLLAYFGVEVDTGDLEWTTAHGDLHWGNLTAPELFLLDWDSWGAAPAGYDAALLLCASLSRPALAARVRSTFADVLYTRSGRVAQLLAAARLLHHVERGEHLDLAVALHDHARALFPALPGPGAMR